MNVLNSMAVKEKDMLTSKEMVLPSNRQSKLVHPHQPYHDDFLDTMRKIFQWSRCFGVAGTSHILWKIWGLLMLLLMIAIEAGAIYKLVKLLAGLTLYSAGNRSVTARLAGTIFYTSSMMSLILSWRLSSQWNRLSAQWASVERRSSMTIGSDSKLKRRMITVTCIMASISLFEHLMSMISLIELDCPPSLILQKYILSSHAFILIESDYTLWVAILLLFMSNIATILWNFQDVLIVLLSMGLTSRYYRLNQCIAKISECDRKEAKWCKNAELLKVYMWRKIRDAYVKQAMLVRTVDSAVGCLILLSSFGNFYFICLQLFLGITQGISGDILKRMYYMVSLGWLCIRYSCVVLAAADVNIHSRRALQYLHACNAKCYNIEVDRLQNQLTKDYVALTGMGFFHLHRSILLQMAGAIITYELVLIQFDTSGFSEHVPLNLTNT